MLQQSLRSALHLLGPRPSRLMRIRRSWSRTSVGGAQVARRATIVVSLGVKFISISWDYCKLYSIHLFGRKSRLRINLSWPHGATPNPRVSLSLPSHTPRSRRRRLQRSPLAATAPQRQRLPKPRPPLSHPYNLRSRGRIADPIIISCCIRTIVWALVH